MNLLENKVVRRLVLIGLFPLGLGLFITLTAGILIFFDLNFLETFRNITYYLYPLAILVSVFLAYRFLYSKRYYSLYNQTIFSENQKLLLPLAFIVIPALLFDIFNVATGMVEAYNFFYLVYLKYLIIAYSILFIVSSSSVYKTVVLLLLSALALLVNEQMFANLADNLTSFIIVLVLIVLPLSASYFIYFYHKKTHNSDVIDKFYYFEVFVIILIFFREIFVNSYPYHMYGYTIQVLSSNINVTLYLFAFICIGVFVYFVEQRFALKKVLSLIAIAVLISIVYIGVSNASVANKTNCDNQISKGANLELTFNDNYLTTFDDVASMRQLQAFLNEQAEKCFRSKTISAGLDLEGLARNNQVVFEFNGIVYLLDQDKLAYQELMSLLLGDHRAFILVIDDEVYVYANRSIAEKERKKMVEIIGKYSVMDIEGEFKYLRLNEKEMAFLIQSYKTMMEASMEASPDEGDYPGYVIFGIVNLNFSEYSEMGSFLTANHADFIKEFKKLREEINND